MATDHEIEQFVRRSADGERSAFECLYGHLIDRTYAYVRFRTNTRADATDVTQDIFIDLYSSLKGFHFQSIPQFYAFVFTITKRKLAKYYSTNAGKNSRQTDLLEENSVPDEQTEDIETNDAVHRALLLLPETTREIIVLHHWSRYTFTEIATLLEMQESTVRVRHHRAIKMLANELTS